MSLLSLRFQKQIPVVLVVEIIPAMMRIIRNVYILFQSWISLSQIGLKMIYKPVILILK